MEQQNSSPLDVKRRHGNLGYSETMWLDSMLDSLVRKRLRSLGAAPNSPVHDAMSKLARDVATLVQTSMAERQKPQK